MTLKELRNDHGLTQAAVAKASGLTLRYYQKLEAGEVALSQLGFGKGVALAEALKVTPKHLLQLKPCEKRQNKKGDSP